MSDRITEYIDAPFGERESWELPFTLTRPDGTAVEADDLTTMTLYLYNRSTGTPVNMAANPTPPPATLKRDILNANGGVVHATNGDCVVAISPDDMVLVDATAAHEIRVAQVEGTYDAGQKEFVRRWVFTILNLRHRPAVEV